MTAPPPPPVKPAHELATFVQPPMQLGQSQLNSYPVQQMIPPGSSLAPAGSTKPPAPIANIAKAISSVMAEVGVVAKDGTNKFHNYKYATIGDVLHKLTPLLGKHGLMIVQNEVEHKFEQRHVAVTYEFTIAHSSGEVWPQSPRKTGMAIATDSKGGWDDKCFNKAATAARKYFLLELFQVPTGDMDDADSDAVASGPPAPPAQQRAPAPPDNMTEAKKFADGLRAPPPPPTTDTSKPHRIVLGRGTGAAAWAEAFIKAIGKATSSDELQAWIETNGPIMANLATSHPDLYGRVQAATTTKHESFEAAPIAAPPDPADDPDAAINAITAALAAIGDQESLEAYWNTNIAPTEDKWFPPDWDILLKEFERNQTRIAAQEAT